jgi:hypothetical protein
MPPETNVAEADDLVAVLLRLQGFNELAGEIGQGYPTDDLHMAANTAGRRGRFRKMLEQLIGLLLFSVFAVVIAYVFAALVL